MSAQHTPDDAIEILRVDSRGILLPPAKGERLDAGPHPNPNVYSDEHTGPLVIVYTD